ncbi:Amylo-alpha-1,6-glucosidase [uncultured archaeon]|nr:Amylo-alpha-1,6-glucosidase [uncultured archaeon]
MLRLSAFDLVPSQSSRHEWLISNGAGGYASSTAIGMNTRKYHGLLIAPLKGTANRHVLLSKMEETALVDGEKISLSTNEYKDTLFPGGYKQQVGFSFSTHPIFSYSLGGARLEKSVRMVHGHDATVVSYRLVTGKEAELEIRPLLAPRPIHADPIRADVAFESDRYGFSINKPAKMRTVSSLGKFTSAPDKYYDMIYRAERERGYPYIETLASPGFFFAKLSRGEELHIVSSLEGFTPSEALELLDRQSLRELHLMQSFTQFSGVARTDFSDMLLHAADSFACIRGKHHGVIAGYPWFSEWGRDAYISLPGLFLSTGRHAMAREILLQGAQEMKNGLCPNFIGEDGKPSYTSADASLWLISAIREYSGYTGDYSFIEKSLWKHMKNWLSDTMRGNSLVRMESDCLLSVSKPASTWMDAQIGGKAVTPRKGKPIEMNALWNSNVHFMQELALRFSDRRTADICAQVSDGILSSFTGYLSAEEGLFDVLDPNDSSLRPNQIFAVSLPHSPLNTLQQKHIFNLVRSRLYTPLGLRTLSPDDKRYCDTYSGNQEARDGAYHQGIIWPWLLGAFYDAQMKVYPGSEQQVLSALRPFSEAMKEGCIGSIPELYEPKTMQPRGAVSQAWSVAEVLRIYTKVKKSSPEKQHMKEFRVASSIA